MPSGQIECLYPPNIKRDLPRFEDRAETLTHFLLWIKLNREREVTWFNNTQIAIGHLYDSCNVSIEDIYRRISDALIKEFNLWLSTAPITVISSNVDLACSVLGSIKRDILPGGKEVCIDIEDILISHHAYCSLVHDIKDANPDWIPFFFRGGVPPGLAATGAFFAEESDRCIPSSATTRFHWVPGLTHTENKSGCQNKDLFLKALIDKADSNPQGSKLCIFAIDTSFTGSSAPTSLMSTLESLPPAYLSKIDVTLAIFLPVEQNTEKVHKENGLATDKNNAVPISLVDGAGRQVYFHRLKKPENLSINFRFYPIRKSLTEDNEDIIELIYLPSNNGKPTYGVTIRENVKIRVKYMGKEKTSIDMAAKERADTIHDWFFNSFNPSRLKCILSAVGLSPHIDKATEHILGQSDNIQYKNQGCRFPVE